MTFAKLRNGNKARGTRIYFLLPQRWRFNWTQKIMTFYFIFGRPPKLRIESCALPLEKFYNFHKGETVFMQSVNSTRFYLVCAKIINWYPVKFLGSLYVHMDVALDLFRFLLNEFDIGGEMFERYFMDRIYSLTEWKE